MALCDTNDSHFFYDGIVAAREEDEVVGEINIKTNICANLQGFICQNPAGQSLKKFVAF